MGNLSLVLDIFDQVTKLLFQFFLVLVDLDLIFAVIEKFQV